MDDNQTLRADEPVLTMTVAIRRAATGQVEEYTIVGRLPEGVEPDVSGPDVTAEGD